MVRHRLLASSLAALGGAAVAAPGAARASEGPVVVSPAITLSVALGRKIAQCVPAHPIAAVRRSTPIFVCAMARFASSDTRRSAAPC